MAFQNCSLALKMATFITSSKILSRNNNDVGSSADHAAERNPDAKKATMTKVMTLFATLFLLSGLTQAGEIESQSGYSRGEFVFEKAPFPFVSRVDYRRDAFRSGGRMVWWRRRKGARCRDLGVSAYGSRVDESSRIANGVGVGQQTLSLLESGFVLLQGWLSVALLQSGTQSE